MIHLFQHASKKNTSLKPETYTKMRAILDNALKNNQVKAVNLMIDYIIKYQDNLVSFYLFRYTLPTIIEKGISICPLLTSHIF